MTHFIVVSVLLQNQTYNFFKVCLYKCSIKKQKLIELQGPLEVPQGLEATMDNRQGYWGVEALHLHFNGQGQFYLFFLLSQPPSLPLAWVLFWFSWLHWTVYEILAP